MYIICSRTSTYLPVIFPDISCSPPKIVLSFIPKIRQLILQLLVTVSLLDELEAEDSPIDSKEDQDSESSLSQQMNGLGPSLASIGNELKSLSEDKLNEIREASLLSQSSWKGSSKERRCWTHCRTLSQNDLHAKELMELRKATEWLFQAFNQSNSVTVEVIYRNHIMERGIFLIIKLMF